MMDEDSYYNYSDGNSTNTATPIHVQTVASSAATPAEMHAVSSSSGSSRRTPFQRFGNSQPQPTPTPTPPTVRGSGHGGTRNPRLSSEERGVRGASTTTTTTTFASTPSPHAESPNACTGVAHRSEASLAATVSSVPRPHPAHPPHAASAGASTVPSPTSTTTRTRSPRTATSETPSGVAGRPAVLHPATAAAARAVDVQRQAASANAISPAALMQLRSHIAHSHGLAEPPMVVDAGTEGSTALRYVSNTAAAGPSSSVQAVRQEPSRSATTRRLRDGQRGTSSVERGEDESVGETMRQKQPTPSPPQLRPVVVAKSATVERRTTTGNGSNVSANEMNAHMRPSSAEASSKGAANAGGAIGAQSSRATGNTPFSPLKEDVVVPMLEPIRTDVSESLTPSLMESAAGLEGDLAPEVAEACHAFLQHLPVPWARSVVRAVTLQTATLQVPPRLLRAPALFDAYAEIRGEVSAALEAAATAAAQTARATTATPAAVAARNNRNANLSINGGGVRGSGKDEAASPLFHTINLQQLLTVAPALLRHRLHNTRTSKVDELRAGFRSNAQTAARTEASVNRYAYLPHVQRDVHYGAVLAQSVPRRMTPGPRLTDGTAHHKTAASSSSNNSSAPQSARFSPRQHVPHVTSAPSLAPTTTTTYTAVSFENFPSIFLKDRFDVAQTERLGTSSGGGGNYRNGNRRRRRIAPFFERDFVATIAVGQEEAAMFASTLTPEFMVGLPSFLKHPERAVPLSLAASLHHLYSALTLELFLNAYTAAALRTAAGEEGAAAHNAAVHPASGNVLSLTSSEVPQSPSPLSMVLRGPAVELGALYVRNTIVCSASTPGMESYLVFLHQIVYPDQASSPMAASTTPPPPCRALVQLSEEANGSMAAPAPVHAHDSSSGRSSPAPGTFQLPTMKHAAVEMTQLVTWVQDVRSHDPRHGQPFSCHLTFVPTHIPDVAAPTLARLCEAAPQVGSEDPNAFPCAVVMGTVDLWKALPPPEVSNLLRIFFVLDRHAQRVMELESPDYGTEEEAAAAAAAKTRDSTEDGEGVAEAANPVSRAIAFPDQQVRQHVATAIEAQVRAYIDSVSALRRDSDTAFSSSSSSTSSSSTLRQRLVSYFMARLHFYEDLNERHCRTEEELQREELQRMARQRAHVQPSMPPPPPTPAAAAVAVASNSDIYEVRGKSLGDALAVALAAEAVAVSANAASRRGHSMRDGKGWSGLAQPTGVEARGEMPLTDEDSAVPAPSVVVLLVPQRDVQRR